MNEKGIQVKMLGDFSISCGGAVIDKNSHPSRKTRILLAYLLHSQGRMVPTGELTAALAGAARRRAPSPPCGRPCTGCGGSWNPWGRRRGSL